MQRSAQREMEFAQIACLAEDNECTIGSPLLVMTVQVLGANALKLGKAKKVKKVLIVIFLLGFIFCVFGFPSYLDFSYASHMPYSPQVDTGRIYPTNVNRWRGEYSIRYVNKKELERVEFGDKLAMYGGLLFFVGIGALKVYWK